MCINQLDQYVQKLHVKLRESKWLLESADLETWQITTNSWRDKNPGNCFFEWWKFQLVCWRQTSGCTDSCGWRQEPPATTQVLGLVVQTKKYLWQTCGIPVLTYAMHCLAIKPTSMKRHDYIQGNIMKRTVRLPRPAHSTALMSALWLPTIKQFIMKNSLSLWHHVAKSTTPARDLNNAFLT